MKKIVVLLKKASREGLYCEDANCGKKTDTHHFILKSGKLFGVCTDCRLKFRILLGENQDQTTGGSTMKTKTVKKEGRVSASDILIPRFSQKLCPPNEQLIKEVKAATGSKKFDNTQLAWYKSQFRRGLLKGQNEKPGHVITQADDKPAAKPSAKKAVKVVKKASKKVAEPVED